jgi:chemotaxis signal transduction protein
MSDIEEKNSERDFFIFEINGRYYAIETLRIVGVVGDFTCQPISYCDPRIIASYNSEGKVVLIVDACACFELEQVPDSEGQSLLIFKLFPHGKSTEIGIKVNKAEGNFILPVENIQPAHPAVTSSGRISGSLLWGDDSKSYAAIVNTDWFAELATSHVAEGEEANG